MSDRVPFSAPSEQDEHERTTAGRKLCPSCGEYAYPRREAGSSGPFSLAPECELCGEPLAGDDRNADLVGFEFAGITVEGSAPWNDAYVLVTTPQGPSCRPASLVRARKLAG